MLAQIRLATLKRGNPKRRPKTLAADKGYDARWLRKKLRTKGIRPQIKKRHRGKKPLGRPMRGNCASLSAGAFLLVSTQV
jgi:IS5 family transposase